MAEKIVFTADEEDLLKELMNIAYGNATAVIADFLENFATLSIPSFDIFSPPELQAYLQKRCELYSDYAKQAFSGEFSGETMLFLDHSSIGNIAKSLHIDESEGIPPQEIILELMNILNSTLISRLAQELHTEVSFSIPSADSIDHLKERLPSLLESYTQVIIIHTIFEFEKEHIKGEIAIFTKDAPLKWIHKTIQEMVAELLL